MNVRRAPRLFAVAAVALVGLTACTSDPSPKRVAQDLVRTLTKDQPEVQACMLDVIDTYSADDLEKLGKDVNDGDAASQAAARDGLAKFEADLAACRG